MHSQDDSDDTQLLSCTAKDQLRVHLHNILTSPDQNLLRYKQCFSTARLSHLSALVSPLPNILQDDSDDAQLLSCTTKDQLRMHLHNILASQDRSLQAIQRRIQKAFVVFGEDVVCTRLHATLVGSNQADIASGESCLCGPVGGGGVLLLQGPAQTWGQDYGTASRLLDSDCDVTTLLWFQLVCHLLVWL